MQFLLLYIVIECVIWLLDFVKLLYLYRFIYIVGQLFMEIQFFEISRCLLLEKIKYIFLEYRWDGKNFFK